VIGFLDSAALTIPAAVYPQAITAR
jgi:hypothetical protein